MNRCVRVSMIARCFFERPVLNISLHPVWPEVGGKVVEKSVGSEQILIRYLVCQQHVS